MSWNIFKRNEEKRTQTIGAVAVVIVILVAVGIIWFVGRNKIEPAPPAGDGSATGADVLSEGEGASVLAPISIINSLAGFDSPKRYLVLFLNNAELQAGGGFMGSYATVRLENGVVKDLFVQGSEFVGRTAEPSAFPPAPQALAGMTSDNRWHFRYANWSPDFFTSAEQAVLLYRLQTGDAESFDGVVGFTPNVLQSLLEITGPVLVDGIEFTPSNVVDKIQYEVELGFAERGLPSRERKKIIFDLTKALLGKLGDEFLSKLDEIFEQYRHLLEGRHMMIAVFDKDLQNELTRLGWSGLVADAPTDYLLVVDSNINSSKTDPAVKRSIMYKVRPDKDSWLAEVTIDYSHERPADWRTTAYQSYTRVYVPAGAELVSAEGLRALTPGARADKTEELGKTVFGGSFVIPPLRQHRVRLTYRLPASVGEAIAAGAYDLYAQKQLGAAAYPLRFDIQFNEPIASAEPAGSVTGALYQQTVTLDRDRTFHVTF